MVGEVVRKVNSSDEAQSAGLRIKVVRWEDLPPGEAKDNDYQARIDGQLRRAGLDRAHIYIGFMRGRIGTRTRQYQSGTIYEFEAALVRRRRTGQPAEVFFYFLNQESDQPPPIAEFRDQLRARGFLYSTVSDSNEFAERLFAHLINVVVGWRLWRNRLRRAVRAAQAPLVLSVSLAIASFLIADAGSAWSIGRALKAGDDTKALETWSGRQSILPITRHSNGSQLMAALRNVAAERLFESLLAVGGDPFDWERTQLRVFERTAIQQYASRLLLEPDFAAASARRRLATVALTRNWDMAQVSATLELSNENPQELIVTDGYVRHAPAEHVSHWLRREARPSLEPSVAARLLQAIADRDDTLLTAAALQLLASGKFGKEVAAMDFPFSCHDAVCARTARELLETWTRASATPPEALLASVLDLAKPELSLAAPEVIAPGLMEFAKNRNYASITDKIVGALAQLDSADVRVYLSDLLTEHLQERTSFGFREKAALIDALPALQHVAPDRLALQVAILAATQGADLSTANDTPADGVTQVAYLEYLAEWPPLTFTMHMRHVRELVIRRSDGRVSSWLLTDFDKALQSVIAQMNEAEVLRLFDYNSTVVIDDFAGRLGTRRAYLVGLLQQMPAFSPALLRHLVRMIPVVPESASVFHELLATRGGLIGREYFRQRFAEGENVLEYIAANGDEETLRKAMPHPEATDGAPNDKLREFIAALSLMEGEPRIQILKYLCDAWAVNAPQLLWAAATSAGFRDDRLIEAALTALRTANDVARYAAAVQYVHAVAPAHLWPTLSEPATSAATGRLLARADKFDIVQIAQSLPLAPAGASNTFWMNMAVETRLLVSFDSVQVEKSAALADRFMRIGDKWVCNPLMQALVPNGAPAAANALFTGAQSGGPVRTLGSLSQPEVVFGAYVIWLAAEIAAENAGAMSEVLTLQRLFEHLEDREAITTRAAAGLALAASRQGPT